MGTEQGTCQQQAHHAFMQDRRSRQHDLTENVGLHGETRRANHKQHAGTAQICSPRAIDQQRVAPANNVNVRRLIAPSRHGKTEPDKTAAGVHAKSHAQCGCLQPSGSRRPRRPEGEKWTGDVGVVKSTQKWYIPLKWEISHLLINPGYCLITSGEASR